MGEIALNDPHFVDIQEKSTSPIDLRGPSDLSGHFPRFRGKCLSAAPE
jgi:hypothetical protein